MRRKARATNRPCLPPSVTDLILRSTEVKMLKQIAKPFWMRTSPHATQTATKRMDRDQIVNVLPVRNRSKTTQTRETERATSTTTYKLPSPELCTCTHKDTRSRTSESHHQLQSTRRDHHRHSRRGKRTFGSGADGREHLGATIQNEAEDSTDLRHANRKRQASPSLPSLHGRYQTYGIPSHMSEAPKWTSSTEKRKRIHVARKRHSVSYESRKDAMNGVTEQLQERGGAECANEEFAKGCLLTMRSKLT